MYRWVVHEKEERFDNFSKSGPLVQVHLPALQHQLEEFVPYVLQLRQNESPHYSGGQLPAHHLRVGSATQGQSLPCKAGERPDVALRTEMATAENLLRRPSCNIQRTLKMYNIYLRK